MNLDKDWEETQRLLEIESRLPADFDEQLAKQGPMTKEIANLLNEWWECYYEYWNGERGQERLDVYGVDL